MKKILHVLFLLSLTAVIFNSCTKNNYVEDFNFKNKISKIWVKSESDTMAYYDFFYNRSETRIENIFCSDWSFINFTYNTNPDSSNQIISVYHFNRELLHDYYEEIFFKYDSSGFVNKMNYYCDNILRKTVTFTRRENHSISSITELFDFPFYDSMNTVWSNKSNLYNMLMPDNDLTKRILATKKNQKAGNLQFECVSIPVYEVNKDNKVTNVIKLYKSYYFPKEEYSSVSTYTYYENFLNPYFQMPFVFKGITSLSYNVKKSEFTTFTLKHEDYPMPDITVNYTVWKDAHNKTDYPDRITETSTGYFNTPITSYFMYKKVK